MISIALGLALTVAATPASMVAADTEDPCCFTNRRFAGVCEVTPDEDATCTDILDYLNNPHSVGRLYCGNTDLRGGWKQVPCDRGQETMCAGGAEARTGGATTQRTPGDSPSQRPVPLGY